MGGYIFLPCGFFNISSQDFFLTPLPLTPEGDFARDFLVRIMKKYFQENWSWRVNKKRRGLKKSRFKILKTWRRDWLDFQLWVNRWGHMSPPPFHIDEDRYSHTQPLSQNTDKKRHTDIKTHNDRERQRETETHSAIETPTHTSAEK